jgi:flagellar hook assembly protein FlgD
VYLKTGANVIELNVEDGAVVAEPSLQLTGKVEPGSAVQINNQSVSVGMLGDFQTSLPLLRGENVIEIQATDQAGNVTRAMRRITYDPQNAQALDLQAVGENFNQAPWLIVPTVVLLGLVLGIVYWRQNRVSLALSVNQSVFVPGGLPGGGANQLEIGLDLSKTARVSLEVLDQQGYPRATLLHNRRKMGRKHLFLWNGMDDQARPLPPGEYTIQAEAGVAPLQVTSALQVRIERPGVSGLGTPIATRQHNLDEVSQRR